VPPWLIAVVAVVAIRDRSLKIVISIEGAGLKIFFRTKYYGTEAHLI